MLITETRKPRLAVAKSALSVSLFHLNHLLQAGVGTAAALHELSVLETSYSMQRVWKAIARKVEGGYTVSDAMRDWPRVFDAIQIALIQAGESRGELAQACHSCMRLLQWQASVKARFTTVLLYPVFALILLVGVVGFLMVAIVPTMGRFLGANSVEITWHTKGLLFASQVLSEHGLLIIFAIIVIALLIGSCRFFNENFELFTDRYLLQLPLIGRVIKDVSLSRYGHTCAQLYGSGIALGDAMLISEGVVENRALRQALSRARGRIQEGASLTQALDAVPHIPGVFKRLLSAGESAGALQSALKQASRQQQLNTDYTLQRAEKLIGPSMLMIVGLVVLWIVVSLLGPVYQSAIDTVLAS